MNERMQRKAIFTVNLLVVLEQLSGFIQLNNLICNSINLIKWILSVLVHKRQINLSLLQCLALHCIPYFNKCIKFRFCTEAERKLLSKSLNPITFQFEYVLAHFLSFYLSMCCAMLCCAAVVYLIRFFYNINKY